MRSTVASVLTCASILVSCGGDGRDVIVAATTPPESTARETAAGATRGEATATSVAADDLSDLASVVITLGDLPAGWVQLPVRVERQPGDGPMNCLELLFEELEVFLLDDRASAAASFEHPDMLLNTMVVSGFTNAEQYLDEFPDAANSCDGIVDAEAGTFSVQPLPFPDLGDDTFATHVEFQLALRVTVLVAVTRVGDVVVVAFVIGTGREDAALLEDVMRTMVGRL